MLRIDFLIIIYVILYSHASIVLQRNKKHPEYVNLVAKEMESKFNHVIHNENYTLFALNNNVSVPVIPRSMFKNLPDFWDWRDKGVISPVKDQKHCHACWAFSSVACIESHLAISQGIYTILSEQFLIDCVRYGKPDAPKCGDFTLLQVFGGVLAESDYRPYSASAKRCSYNGPPTLPLPVIGVMKVPSNEIKMAVYLVNYGPLSAAINANSMAVYPKGKAIDEPSDEKCSPRPEDMNHGVLIVGFNVYVDHQRVVPYWIIKNSWGAKWGDKGFYYLVRGRNACGIANDVSFALVP